MSKLIICCGVPGTGKSTWIQNHVGFDDVVVSRDAIRFALLDEMPDGADYFSREDDVWALYIEEINKGLRRGKTVWADATHLNPKVRLKLLHALSVRPTHIEIIQFWCPLEVALKRNAQRAGRSFVPPEQIKKMYYNQLPAEFGEGKFEYDYIYEINTVDGKINIREEIFK